MRGTQLDEFDLQRTGQICTTRYHTNYTKILHLLPQMVCTFVTRRHAFDAEPNPSRLYLNFRANHQHGMGCLQCPRRRCDHRCHALATLHRIHSPPRSSYPGQPYLGLPQPDFPARHWRAFSFSIGVDLGRKVQRICCLALCGIHLRPPMYLSSSTLVGPYCRCVEFYLF